MARHRIGQQHLWGARMPWPGSASLDDLLTLVDWRDLDQLLAGISASPKGELGWPPLALFRARLLATWHDLSDVRLAEALDDRASFRRFCGFSTHETTPERTTFVPFRAELVRLGLDRALFAAVTRQLDRRGVVVRTGTLVDATLIPSASTEDDEARWAGHRRRKPVHGYKAHIATDQEAGLIHGVEVTTANAHDASELETILPEAPGDTYGDSSYQDDRPEGIIRARGGRPRVVYTGGFGGEAAAERLRAHNAEVRRVRCRIEKVFGTAKRSYGLRRMRWLGLAKAGLQVRLAAVAYNLRRTLELLAAMRHERRPESVLRVFAISEYGKRADNLVLAACHHGEVIELQRFQPTYTQVL